MPQDPVPTMSQWNALLKGRAADARSDHCMLLIRKYHTTPGTDTDERYRILDEIDTLCLGYLRSFGANWRTAPLLVPMRTLGMIAERHKKNIRKAKTGWGKLRSGFAPGGGAGKMLVNRSAGLDTPSAEGNYWLERADPRHRSWGHEGVALFDQWYQSTTTLSFWEWLEATGQADHQGVMYLDPNERWRYWVVFGDDRRLWMYDEGSRQFKRFSTQGHHTAFSGRGFAIYVCSPQGILYSGSHTVSRFHHSSFLSGKPVMGAGEWVVSNGVILLITHKTGHYQATPQNLLNVVRHLELRTNIDRAIVAVTDFAAHKLVYLNARQWLDAGGNTAQCREVTEINVPQQATLRATMGIDWDNLKNNVYAGDRPAESG